MIAQTLTKLSATARIQMTGAWQTLIRPLPETTFRPSWVPWSATVGAVLLLKAVNGLKPLTQWAPGDIVLTATLIALIWTGYHTFQLAEQSRRSMERDAVARERARDFLLTALSSELGWVNQTLNTIIEHPRRPYDGALAHPRLEAALAAPGIGSMQTAGSMALVAAALRHLDVMLKLRDMDPGAASPPAIAAMADRALTEVEALSRKVSVELDMPELPR